MLESLAAFRLTHKPHRLVNGSLLRNDQYLADLLFVL
jgi:hypothetical protein